MRKKTKVLIVAANPKETSRLRLDEEVREIEEALQRSRYRNQFSIKSKWAPRSKDLRRALLDEQPQILHFSGHGGPNGLVIENSVGEAAIIPPDGLKGLFNLFSKNLECVLLNACYSETQASAISARIPYVIGMKEEIADDLAIEFTVGFYDALGAGRTIDEAFQFANNAIEMLGRSEELQSVLLSKQPLQFSASSADLNNNAYRFRAECQVEVDELRRLIGIQMDRITIVNTAPFPDVEVEIETSLSLNELRDLMRQVVDGHVMVQTVAPTDEYTGERNYDL